MNKDFWDKVHKLEELAEKATQGEWVIKLDDGIDWGDLAITTEPRCQDAMAEIASIYDAALREDEIHNDFQVEQNANAEYIAAANPAMIKEMIAELRRLEEDFEAAARSAADESVKAVRLDEEADWLAEQASLICDCIENCDECRLFLECGCDGENSRESWRKAAQKAIAEGEARIKESQPDA